MGGVFERDAQLVFDVLTSENSLLSSPSAHAPLPEEEVKQVVETAESEFLIGFTCVMKIRVPERETLIRACVAITIILGSFLRIG